MAFLDEGRSPGKSPVLLKKDEPKMTHFGRIRFEDGPYPESSSVRPF
jgi:hypothetical protein